MHEAMDTDKSPPQQPPPGAAVPGAARPPPARSARRGSKRRRRRSGGAKSKQSEAQVAAGLAPQQMGEGQEREEPEQRGRKGQGTRAQCQSEQIRMAGVRVPNLGWRAPSMAVLRSCERFVGLPPPVDGSRAAALHEAAVTRQDTIQWRELHVGRLTTSTFAAALGFFEPPAPKALSMPKSIVSRGRILGAHQTLKDVGAALTEHLPQLCHAEAAAAEAVRILDYNLNTKDVDMDWGVTPDMARMSLRAARGGSRSVAMAAGSIQEAAALHATAALFPQAVLLECGMFPVEEDVLQRLGKRTVDAELALGASPDAVMAFSAAAVAASAATARATASPTPPEAMLLALGAAKRPVSAQAAASHRAVAASVLGVPLDDVVLLAVEVKSRSPFFEPRDGSGRTRSTHGMPHFEVVREMDARANVNPLHVPQLQLHALAMGAAGTVNVHFSPGGGACAFYVPADADYMASALRLLGKLSTEARAPSSAFYARSEEHRALYARTARMASRASRVCAGGPGEVSYPGAHASQPFVRAFVPTS